jgi:hypothetical protein
MVAMVSWSWHKLFYGRKIPAWLDSLGLTDVAGEGHTAHF